MPEGVAVGEAELRRDRRVIGMRVELQHVERFVEAPDDRESDRVGASEHHGKGAPPDHVARQLRDRLEAPLGVGRVDIGVAEIGDQALRHLVGEIVAAGLDIVDAIPSRQAQRMLANGARSHSRARQEG